MPVERDHNLAYGSVIHDCLELWHRHRDLDRVLEHIDRTYPERAGDEKQRADWHLPSAMMTGYAARYPQEDFEVVALEKTFEGKIVNPATGASSRSFTLAGKVSQLRISDWRLRNELRGGHCSWRRKNQSAIRNRHSAIGRLAHQRRRLQHPREGKAAAAPG